jgi:hypothetical protein
MNNDETKYGISIYDENEKVTEMIFTIEVWRKIIKSLKKEMPDILNGIVD